MRERIESQSVIVGLGAYEPNRACRIEIYVLVQHQDVASIRSRYIRKKKCVVPKLPVLYVVGTSSKHATLQNGCFTLAWKPKEKNRN